MSNVLKMDKRESVLGLGRLKWSTRQIEASAAHASARPCQAARTHGCRWTRAARFQARPRHAKEGAP
jgi:hypothetical protein